MANGQKAITVVLRPKRQITLPRTVAEQLGIRPGDALELQVEDATLVARPKKAIALEALQEIREAFARSGITEEAWLEAGRRARRKAFKELYGSKK